MILLVHFRNWTSSWIGLNDREKEGVFQWGINTNVSTDYVNWHTTFPKQPNGGTSENCVELIPAIKFNRRWDGKWNDYSCSLTNSFICQKPQGIF